MTDGWIDDRYCFACGEKNPIGMHLHFVLTDEGIEAKYAFPKELQGYSGIVHGGMISLLLDEVMVNLPWLKLKQPVVSADIRIKFIKPLKIGEIVVAKAFIEKQKKNIFWVKSVLIRERDGVKVAEAEAVCVQVSLEQMNA
ncbi:MAG: PaaI family thioesterase [bacterium]